MVTGASDGCLKYFRSLNPSVRSDITPKTYESPDDVIRSVNCLDPSGDLLLLSFVSGYLCVYRWADGCVLLWLDERENLKSYSCVDVFRKRDAGGKFAAAGLNGALVVYVFRTEGDAVVVESKRLLQLPGCAGGRKTTFLKWLSDEELVVSTVDDCYHVTITSSDHCELMNYKCNFRFHLVIRKILNIRTTDALKADFLRVSFKQ